MKQTEDLPQELSGFFKKGSPTALKLSNLALKNIDAIAHGFTPYQYDQYNKEIGYERY